MIQFDLACGILDLKNEEAGKAAERAMNGQEPHRGTRDTSPASDSEGKADDSDSECESDADLPDHTDSDLELTSPSFRNESKAIDGNEKAIKQPKIRLIQEVR